MVIGKFVNIKSLTISIFNYTYVRLGKIHVKDYQQFTVNVSFLKFYKATLVSWSCIENILNYFYPRNEKPLLLICWIPLEGQNYYFFYCSKQQFNNTVQPWNNKYLFQTFNGPLKTVSRFQKRMIQYHLYEFCGWFQQSFSSENDFRINLSFYERDFRLFLSIKRCK